MKKSTKKILLIIICIFLTMFQTNYKVYGYTLPQVKSHINFRTVEEDGKPKKYDIIIDAKNLMPGERIPDIRIGIEDILYAKDAIYSENNLLNIDFFTVQKLNDNEDKMREIVKGVYKVSLYIALACMLTLLIYISIKLVLSSINEKNYDEEKNEKNEKKEKNGKVKEETPEHYRKWKKTIEQWFLVVFQLTSAIFILSIITSFSNVIVDIVDSKQIKDESIVIYVKNSKMAESAAKSISSIMSGDESLRNKVAKQAKSLDNLEVASANSFKWVKRVYEKVLGKNIPNQCCAHTAKDNSFIVSSTSDDIVEGAAVFSDVSSLDGKSKVTDSKCGQDAGHIGIYIGDGKIATYTGKGETGVTICTIEEWKSMWKFSGWGWLPGTDEIKTQNLAKNSSTKQSSSSKKIKTVNYYFETNLEGALMFQTQFSWTNSTLKNMLNITVGASITLFKCLLYGFYWIRMMVIAFITALTPILIIINAIKKIRGENGFLRKWFKLYLYMIFIKPLIGIMYYVLVMNCSNLIKKVPFYIIPVEFLIVIGTVLTSYRVFKSLLKKG